MDPFIRILILASPGHYRDSMVALLRTIPRLDLVFADSSPSEIDSFCTVEPTAKETSKIVLVDLDPALSSPVKDRLVAARLDSIKSSLPRARLITLVDNLYHTREAERLGADCILPRSISAGEFLTAIRESDSFDHNVPGRLSSLILSADRSTPAPANY
jgi:DNA-binding NarL/FixJ family response regulator